MYGLVFFVISILPMVDELATSCLTLDPDITCITETCNIEDQEIALATAVA